MQCASYERDYTSANAACTGIDRARELLDAALTTTREDIGAVATQFEMLSSEVQRILELTSPIVDCVREDWVASIVPVAHRLDVSARRFIEERIESLAAISNVFTNEAKMLENLLSLTADQRSIAHEGKNLGVLASIEVAGLGAAGRRFEYMARELDEFSAMISSGTEEVRTEARQRRITLIDRHRKFNLTLQRRREYFHSIERELGEAIATMDSVLAELARIPADFQECVAMIAANISRVVEAVQMQDVTRQQTEHVRDALIRVSGEDFNCEPRSCKNQERRSAILRIQALQVESVRHSTKEWVEQVNQCLESILAAGSSDVVAMGAKILAQERRLSSQLARIERLQRDCDVDDAEIEVCLAGLGALMRITKTHLERSRLARDRMQLLNFNSMIEARHLGSQASAVLEITRNIGRISTVWSQLTDRSDHTLEAMLTSSARADEAHRTRTRLGMEALGNARRESQAGLATLSQAAAIADRNGKKIDCAIATLHDEIKVLRRIAERLTHSVALLLEAREEIDEASDIARSSAAALTNDELQQIETECAQLYTSELERRILRAALYGEAMPLAAAAVTANDVELF
jgi:hypothetical protein